MAINIISELVRQTPTTSLTPIKGSNPEWETFHPSCEVFCEYAIAILKLQKRLSRQHFFLFPNECVTCSILNLCHCTPLREARWPLCRVIQFERQERCCTVVPGALWLRAQVWKKHIGTATCLNSLSSSSSSWPLPAWLKWVLSAAGWKI